MYSCNEGGDSSQRLSATTYRPKRTGESSERCCRCRDADVVVDVATVACEERVGIGCIDGGKNDVLDELFATIGEISTPSLSSARLQKMSKSKKISKAHHPPPASAPAVLLNSRRAKAQRMALYYRALVVRDDVELTIAVKRRSFAFQKSNTHRRRCFSRRRDGDGFRAGCLRGQCTELRIVLILIITGSTPANARSAA